MPWKAASLGLLLLCLSALCQSQLLIREGVEANPGPNTVDDILAEICVGATNTNVRDYLQLYNKEFTTTQLKRTFSKCYKTTLVDTMDYLRVPGQGEYNKDTVINNLIVRIQNLLPDFCNMCQSEYRTKISEPAAISWPLCGQAAHKACIAEKLGISPEDLLLLRSEEVLKKVNPLKLKGIHYLCGACEENFIPSNESGKMKRRKSAVPENRPPIISLQEDIVAAESQSSESDNGDSQAPGPANATQVNTTEPSSAAPSGVTPVNSNNVRQTQDRGVASHAHVSERNRNDVTSASVCRFYRKGTRVMVCQPQAVPNSTQRPAEN